jgi:hypothetical protein
MSAEWPRPCPVMRRHRRLDAAYVSFRVRDRRRTIYFGRWNSKAAAAKFARFARLWPAQLREDVRAGKWPAVRLLTFAGRTQSVAAWAAETGLTSSAIRFRLGRGWDVERTLSTPSQQPYFARDGVATALAAAAAER